VSRLSHTPDTCTHARTHTSFERRTLTTTHMSLTHSLSYTRHRW